MNSDVVHDLVLLDSITEDAICETLKNRYKKDEIYTFIGPVLISVNPFKNISKLYSSDMIKKYDNACYWENPPHVFALSEDVYTSVKTTKKNQCVIISGESGAGKTEASKLILKYISEASKNIRELEIVKNKLIASNPVLESFGNAKTIRNDNSSRFGKYFEIIFDFAGNPIGGVIKNYLLEKVRVVKPMNQERDFHIFYQLLYGISNAKEREELFLEAPEFYKFLTHSDTLKLPSIDDKKDYLETIKAMETSGFTTEEIDQIKRILSAILWLGQVQFSVGKTREHAMIEDTKPIEIVTKLLSLPEGLLYATLTGRQFAVGDKVTMTNLNKDKAEYTRDSLCKDMYSKMFDWIIKRINESIDPKNFSETSSYDSNSQILIGVLDIYGFEIFEHNSFEQFCINYVNEKLQQIFIEQTLKTEQEEYIREEIEWIPVEYFNNKIVCDLIEDYRNGILAYLNEECIRPEGNDEQFYVKTFKNNLGHPHLESLKNDSSMFILKHYAGDVKYEIEGFVDKNKDYVWKDLILLGDKSGLSTLNEIYSGFSESFSKKRPETQSMQFKKQIFGLVDSLLKCNPHYIRCIKPNDFKRPDNYDEQRVMHQIKYLGLKENVRVRRAGYALRTEYNEFYKRYKIISKQTWPKYEGEVIEAVSILTKEQNLKEKEDFVFGKTKIFIKNPKSVFFFENTRKLFIENVMTRVKCVIRICLAKDILAKSLAARTIQQKFKVFCQAKKSKMERIQALNIYDDKKVRRRFSIILFPVGDYLYLSKSNLWKNYSSKKLKDTSKVQFSDFCYKFTRGFKPEERIVVMTDKNIFFVHFTKTSKNLNMRFDRIKEMGKFRKLALETIRKITVGSYHDNFVGLTTDRGISTLICCDRKSELITCVKNHLEKTKNGEVKIEVTKEAVFKVECGTTQKVVFDLVEEELKSIEKSVQVIKSKKEMKILASKKTAILS